VDAIDDGREAVAVLERELKAAVAREDYRTAAALQKKIDEARRGKGEK
jgi:protein-arginine kinase activator protein McsA